MTTEEDVAALAAKLEEIKAKLNGAKAQDSDKAAEAAEHGPDAALVKEQGATEQAGHTHELAPLGKDGYFCKDCGERMVEVNNVKDVLGSLDRSHGDASFLDCPTCRADFESRLREQGMDVKDENGELRIKLSRKPAPKK